MTKMKQEIKADNTRKNIINAAKESILAYGLNDFTVMKVAEHAKISRGAILHHYVNRQALMHAVLKDVLEKEIDSVNELAKNLEDKHIDLDGLLDTLWQHFSGDMFMISLEYMAMSRTALPINEVLEPLAKEFNYSMEQIWSRIFKDSSLPQKYSNASLHATLCMMRGMSLQGIWRKDDEFSQEVMSFWKSLLKEYMYHEQLEGKK